MSTETTADRDPRQDPINKDILHRPDLSSVDGIRLCHGADSVTVGDRSLMRVRYELPRKRSNNLKTCSLSDWRTWATKAEVVDPDDLEDLLSLPSTSAPEPSSTPNGQDKAAAGAAENAG